MDEWMEGRMDGGWGWMDAGMDGRMDGWMDGKMDGYHGGIVGGRGIELDGIGLDWIG